MIRSSYFEKSVSRETLLKLTKYHEFLIENNKKISLISKNTEKIAVKRHYEDCAQLIKYIDKTDKTIQCEVEFNRRLINKKSYGSAKGIWVSTFRDGIWALQLRSMIPVSGTISSLAGTNMNNS